MKRIGMRAIMVAALITAFCTVASAQVRQTVLYIDDGNGNFTKITGAHNGGDFSFPTGGGTILTTSMTSPLGPTLGGTGIGSYNTGDLLYASAANTLSVLPIGSANQVLTVVGGVPTWQPAGAASNATYANAQTSAGGTVSVLSTTALMAGLGATIKPTASGKVLITITGSITGNNNGNTAASVQIYYGTGSVPTASESSVTAGGTAVGAVETNGGSTSTPFSCTALVSGLSTSTTYWIDAGVNSSNSGSGHNVSISNATVTAVELP